MRGSHPRSRFVGFTNEGASALYLDPDAVESVEDVAHNDVSRGYPGATIGMRSGREHWVDLPAADVLRLLQRRRGR